MSEFVCVVVCHQFALEEKKLVRRSYSLKTTLFSCFFQADSLGARNLIKHMSMQQNSKDEKEGGRSVLEVKSFKGFIADQVCQTE